MINNFDKFNFIWEEGEFYFFQIIKRKKDNPNTIGINGNNHMRCIKEYSIQNIEKLEKYKQEMIDIANITNSRIYMHPARRSKDKVSKIMLQYIAENVIGNKHNLSGIYRSACGGDSYSEKLWIVDIDIKDLDLIRNRYVGFINNVCKPDKLKVEQIIETINGYHLITSPFDLKVFKNKFPEIEIHKNNPTLIYYGGNNA